jgi:hypothetical protein
LDSAYSVSVDAMGNAYVAGRTAGGLSGPNAGLHDVFVSKYDTGGALSWTRQWGTQYDDIAYSVSADDFGNIYLSGGTYGDLGGTNQGFEDAFIAKIHDGPLHPADFNGDGLVNGGDLTEWKGDFGINGDSDADGDGDTDGADFLAWQRGYGATVLPVAISVPEPIARVLWLAVALPLLKRHRREVCAAAGI